MSSRWLSTIRAIQLLHWARLVLNTIVWHKLCSIQPLHCTCRAQYNNSTARVNQHVNNMDLVLILTITVSIMIILIITILLLDMRISAQLICILLLVIWWRKRVMNELGYGAVCLLKGRPRLTVRCIKKIQAKDHVWGVQNKLF